jgi:hypothetical protein
MTQVLLLMLLLLLLPVVIQEQVRRGSKGHHKVLDILVVQPIYL